jgi:blue light- and temperature-responsive anti-repressor
MALARGRRVGAARAGLATAAKAMAEINQAATAPRSAAGPEFSFAFQPIVDAAAGAIVSYEALIRGRHNESASAVFAQVRAEDLHRFDTDARPVAIELAARLGIRCNLNVNFLPRSVQTSDAPIRSTVDAAVRCGLPLDHIVLEVTEGEMIDDQAQFVRTVNQYRGMGMKVSIDDFGAGYAGLNLLADFQPDQLKLDMNLVRSIERKGPRQAIVRAILQACNDLGIEFLAEGVETLEEFRWFRDAGVEIFQGYLLGKPEFEQLAGYTQPAA